MVKINDHLFLYKKPNLLITTGASGTTTSASGFSQVNIRIKMKSHSSEIYFNIFSFLHKFFINNKFQSFNIKGVI